MMKKYLAFTAKAFQRTLTYRFELWMELFINVLFMFIYGRRYTQGKHRWKDMI